MADNYRKQLECYANLIKNSISMGKKSISYHKEKIKFYQNGIKNLNKSLAATNSLIKTK